MYVYNCLHVVYIQSKKNGPIDIGSLASSPSPTPANWNIVPQLLPTEKQSSPHALKDIDSCDIILVYDFPAIALYHPHILLPLHLYTRTSLQHYRKIRESSQSYRFSRDCAELAPSKVPKQ